MMKKGIAILSVFLFWTGAASVCGAATYTYYLPFFSSKGNGTGVALRNVSDTAPAHVTVRPYESNGTAGTAVVLTLNPRGQWAGIVEGGTGREGWIEVESDQVLVGLCFIQRTAAPKLMYDITLIAELNTLLHVPHVAQNSRWDTTVMVCNPDASSSTITVTVYDKSGVSQGATTGTISARGSKQYPLSGILGAKTLDGGSVKISTGKGVAAFALYTDMKYQGNTGKGYAGISALKPGTETAASYYIPFFNDNGYGVGLALRNCSDSASASATALPSRQAGLPLLAYNEVFTLVSGGQDARLVAGGSNQKGWIRVLSDRALTGLCFIMRDGSPPLMYDITLDRELSTMLYIPHVAENDRWNTTILICNPNLGACAVDITPYGTDGTAGSTCSRTIPANGSAEYRLSDILGGGTMASGSVEIASTWGVAAFALYEEDYGSAKNPGTWGMGYAGISAVVARAGGEGEDTHPYDGVWNGHAVSTSGGPGCGTADFTMTIVDSRITGWAEDSWGDTYDLSGTVDATGHITMGIADGDDNVATYSGQLGDASGSGTWQDDEGCSGTWSADLS